MILLAVNAILESYKDSLCGLMSYVYQCFVPPLLMAIKNGGSLKNISPIFPLVMTIISVLFFLFAEQQQQVLVDFFVEA
jgi:hypothetical protein